MLAPIRRALSWSAALRLAGLTGLAYGLVRQLLGATSLSLTYRPGALALALATGVGVGAVAWAAANALRTVRVRIRPEVPDRGRPVRLGLRRRPVPAPPAEVGWRPSAWDPRDVAPWTPEGERRGSDGR